MQIPEESGLPLYPLTPFFTKKKTSDNHEQIWPQGSEPRAVEVEFHFLASPLNAVLPHLGRRTISVNRVDGCNWLRAKLRVTDNLESGFIVPSGSCYCTTLLESVVEWPTVRACCGETLFSHPRENCER
jgi:hypothetical protein